MPEKIPTHLIVRYLSNEATDKEQEELLEWVSRDTQNQKIFHEYSALWEKKNKGRSAFNPDRGLQRLNAKIDEAETKIIPLFPWRKLAAAVMLLITASATLFLLFYAWSPVETTVAFTEQKAGDEKITLTLPDRSVITLNANTTLRYPQQFSTSKREVYLEGEAFFNVTRDPSRPFIVHAHSLKTEVLGTSFNIHARPDHMSVTVATGKVKVSKDAQVEILLPSDKIVYDQASNKMQRRRVDVEQELAWVTNTLMFDDVPLHEAVKTIEKQFKISITFASEAIKQCRLTGKFKNETLEHILEAVAFSTGVQYQFQNKEVKLSGKGCH